MHDPMVMVFGLGVPIPRTKWKRAAVQPRWGGAVVRSDMQGSVIHTRRFWRRRSAVEWQEYVYAYTHDRTELRRRWPI